mgnify:CR=1 FL=1|nr:MAG TPA: Ellis van Creveld protein 2 like protein [Bacteriophage sp.]DAN02542.1 MAG TPA: Ellis van Creveld protein 2 like protein [Caudoviricetes sp.]DAP37666.1 MAG TPA: Ellis van Creveld protein 2 like protein [Herelleviridae sp.]DAJ83363.1 MAG TPA: Ellis van Creveld protein 2 like protein [Bacteriophage sp.]DAQ73922.1 MAG TPA: Ellis van Creveld protein 2 like protein [Herelleviridae sp.]
MEHLIVLAFSLPFILGILATILVYAFYCVVKAILHRVTK